MKNQAHKDPFPLFLLISLLAVILWSLVRPKEYFTWLLEAFPVIIGLVALAAIYPRFKFTRLACFLIWIHMIILLIGAHYTYAEVPPFNWLRDHFHLSRNYYDRVGHFAQGFVPAIVAREVLIRKSPLKAGKWLAFLVLCFCMAVSAWYELFEWGVARATGSAADAFLGSQGDVWDTQWDMFCAFLGALSALSLLSRVHDRALLDLEK